MIAPAELQLRDYQNRIVSGTHAIIRGGKRTVVVCAPTGSGKRLLAVWWAQRAAEQGKEVLIVTDRRTLVEQMFAELHKRGVEYGAIMSGYPEERIHFVQAASIQSLDSRYLATGEGLPPADLIIIDEGHKALELYAKLLACYPSAIVLKLTATPVGPLGTSLINGPTEAMFEGVKNSQLIRDGYLLPTRVIAPSEPDIEGIRINRASGEYSQKKLGGAVLSVTAFANVFDAWAPFADRKTIVFAPGVAYCRGLVRHPAGADSFYARGIEAAVIEARTKTAERRELFDRFENGDLRVLVSVDVLKEGFDAPIASCGIDLQPNGQLRTLWQKYGRVKRTYADQTEAIWIDMAGNYWKFPHPDEDPEWPTGNETTQDVITRARKAGKPKPVRCPKCGAVRRGGLECPDCHHVCEPREEVRVIRMGNGKLKEIPAVEKQKVEKTETDRLADKWKSELFAGIRAERTMKQARTQFFRRNHFWPPRNLPAMPPPESAEWSRRIADVYSPKELMRLFNGD